MIRPARLSPGDRVSVVAAAGPVNRASFASGAAILGARYNLVHEERIFEQHGFLAGNDATRAAELLSAIEDPTTRAVVAARGGYGIMRVLDEPLLQRLRRSHKPIVGFSDVTALHAACARAGLASIHGPVVTQLAGLPPADHEALVELLESTAPPPPLTDLNELSPGRAEGVLCGGNLTLLASLCGTPYALDLDRAVLLIEDVGERPYRLDRCLTQLRLAGALRGVVGVVIGDLVRCLEPDGTPPLALATIAEALLPLGVPIVAGAPIGHGHRNRAVPLGARVMLDTASGRLDFLDAAVE